MTYKIEEIEGIGPAYATKLATAKIKTTGDLLSSCGTSAGRKSVAETTGVSETHLLKWANMADLMRISGIGQEYSELLEASGVDTVKELATRRADNLTRKMEEVNETKKLTRATPAEKTVSGWITQAGQLSPMISH